MEELCFLLLKLWQNDFKEKVHKQIAESCPLTLNEARQNKHILGTSAFDPKRSTLTADAAELVNIDAGKCDPLYGRNKTWDEKERFVHTSEIGIYRTVTGHEASANAGIIHYSKRKGTHVVPARPKYGRGRVENAKRVRV